VPPYHPNQIQQEAVVLRDAAYGCDINALTKEEEQIRMHQAAHGTLKRKAFMDSDSDDGLLSLDEIRKHSKRIRSEVCSAMTPGFGVNAFGSSSVAFRSHSATPTSYYAVRAGWEGPKIYYTWEGCKHNVCQLVLSFRYKVSHSSSRSKDTRAVPTRSSRLSLRRRPG
jgi:Caulimovirus viroplasmin